MADANTMIRCIIGDDEDGVNVFAIIRLTNPQ